MKKYVVVLAIGLFAQSYGQQSQLSLFDNLIGKTWKSEGTWGDGSKFKQEIEFKYSLDSTLIVSEALGFTNKEQTDYGPRNHGVRKFDKQSNTIKFWEFDVFGGVTEGAVRSKGKDIIYTYAYGESTVTDYWQYVDAHTYNLTIGDFENGQWKQKYLSAQYIAPKKNKVSFDFDHQSLVVTNLMKTGDFYKDVFGFEEIPHPERKPGFRWFNIYGNSQLHLIKKDVIEFKKDKSIHLCLSIQNLEGFIERLILKEIDFYDWPGNKGSVTDRADGVKQIYIQDPEGYWIEINTAKH
jgi:catechol 2,3-dioxygenase-like lactoylglutathione lyase family enzyme